MVKVATHKRVDPPPLMGLTIRNDFVIQGK